MTDSAGAIQNESDYFPYGGEIVISNLQVQNYKFTGKERDSESNLDYFGARYYANVMGRFITPDWSAQPVAVPYADLGNPQTLNLYAYVGNDPIAKADLDGHLGGADPKSCEPDCEQKQVDNSASTTTRKKEIEDKAQNLTGTVTILGQSVPYTIAATSQGAQATALATLNATVTAINQGKDQLAPAQIAKIKAVKAIYIVANMTNPGGMSVTGPRTQRWVSRHLHIDVKIGTFILNGASLSQASAGYWASGFAHEGTHIINHDPGGSVMRESRAYHEQYQTIPAFHMPQNEVDFIRDMCGSSCK